jgi:hypothetical protein
VLVFPSPKFQFHVVGELVEESVNWTVNGAVPEVSEAVKLATGTVEAAVVVVVVAEAVTVIVTGTELVALPPALVAVNVGE